MHKTTPPPQQPNNPLRNLLRQPKPPHRRPILHLIQRIPPHLARRICQRRLDVPRRDGVDLDVGVVEGRGARDAHDAVFGDRVGARVAEPGYGGKGRDVHDGAALEGRVWAGGREERVG